MSKVTIEDVAKAAGVSRALVSIAYRGVAGVSKQTAEHIFAIGAQLGYVPNTNAARLASKKLKTIGVFLQDLHNEVFADIYDGIRDVIGPDISLVLAVGAPTPNGDLAALETLIAARTDVIIAAGLTVSEAQLAEVATRANIISVTRQSPVVHSISADDYVGARLAVAHLLALGHTAIGFLANPQTDGYSERLNGYRDAMTENQQEVLVQQSTYSRDDAETDAQALLDRGVTAVLAHNDSTALGVLDCIVSRRLKPGVDVAVVGFDNTSLSQAPILALSSVDPHSRKLGELAAELALQELEGQAKEPTSMKLEPNLVVRLSSGPQR